MSYKDILVYADTSPMAAARLDLAAALATTHDAHLIALHVDPQPYTPVDLLGTSVGSSVQSWQRKKRQERADSAAHLVESASQRSGVRFEWRHIQGEIDDTLLKHGRYSDLIILSQAANLLDLDSPVEPLTGNIVLAAGRPVIVVPKKCGTKTCGNHVLIAWKPTAEATRAVHESLPILQKAATVTIMEINPDTSEHSHNAGFDLGKHLARHGIKVKVTPVIAPDMDAGSLINSRAEDLGADLVVMGAYGHARLRELIFGGTTRYLLDHLQVPVFLSH